MNDAAPRAPGAISAPISALALGPGSVRIWSMTSADRLDRIFSRTGLTQLGSIGEVTGERSVVLVLADRVFDESLIKSLTSSEPILVRRLNHEFNEVYPKFKLAISANAALRAPELVEIAATSRSIL